MFDRLGRPIRLETHDPPVVRVQRPFDAVDDNNLGQSLELTYGETNQVLLDARGLDHGAENVTCVVSYDRAEGEPLATDDLSTLTLRVEFGIGGTSQLVRCDLVRGLYFSVPATAVRLIVDYPTVSGRTGPTLQVRAVLGYGSKSPSSGPFGPVRLTVPLGVLEPNADSAIVAVPTLATSVVVTSTMASAFPVMFVRQRANLSPSSDVLAESVVSDTPVVLVNGAQGLSVRYTGSQPREARAVFSLAL